MTAPARRPVRAGDDALLLDLFASTRADEVAVLDPASAAALVDLQFRLQRDQYRGRHPEGEELVVLDGDAAAVGRVWVDRSTDPHRILDLTLLPEHRGRGIGSAIVAEEQRVAATAGRDLVVSVFATDAAARRFWERCGFVDEGGSATHRWLRSRAGQAGGGT